MRHRDGEAGRPAVLVLASVASMIDQFNMPNIRLLLEMGYAVHVACNFREGNTCDSRRLQKLHKKLRDMHVVQHQWDCPRSMRPVRDCVRAYRQLAALVSRFHYAWMHCHSPVGGALARIAAHRAGVPVVYTAHGFHFYRGAPVKNWLLYYPAEKLLSYWTDVLITVNKEDYRFAKRNLAAGKVCCIPGIGIRTEKFAAVPKQHGGVRKTYGVPEDAVLLLSVGELSRNKNHKAVITALAALADQNVYYMVCGQGMLKDALLQHAGRLGVAKRVVLTGYQEDTAPFYRDADIFVFPSLREGMPVALMEAMAAGLPCVVSDIRGNRELIAGPNRQESTAGGLRTAGPNGQESAAGGLRFDPGRHRSVPGGNRPLAQALQELLGHPWLWKQYGRYNQRKIQAYDLSIVEKKLEQIYADSMGGNAVHSADMGTRS